MSMIVKETGRTYELIPEDTYSAVCVGLYSIGKQYNEKYGNSSDKIIVQWELTGATYTSEDGAVNNRTTSRTYTMSLNERSALRRDLKSWRGREFTEDELRKFDMNNVLGAPCLIQIIHNKRETGTYDAIGNITKLPKGMPLPKAQGALVSFDVDESPLEDFEKLPEWILKRVKESPNYLVRSKGGDVSIQTAGFTELDDDDEGDLPF